MSERHILEFHMECFERLSKIAKKMIDKSPLKYTVVRNLVCLDPVRMVDHPDVSKKQMKRLIHQLVHDKHIDLQLDRGRFCYARVQEVCRQSHG